jgi:hypothetical protein
MYLDQLDGVQELRSLWEEVMFVEHGVVIQRRKRKRAQRSFVLLGSCALGLFCFVAAMATGWLKGAVKAVPFENFLLIMGSVKGIRPLEKTIILAGLIVPN